MHQSKKFKKVLTYHSTSGIIISERGARKLRRKMT
nr:MAG TPA: hypothetical protein [Caudoviricetes sp.]